MQVDLGRQFLERVVVWPGPQGSGWINLHCHVKNDNPAIKGGKDFVAGWPFKTVDEFISRAVWVESTSQFFDVWYCTSQQNTAATNGRGKPKAVREGKNSTALKAIWIDCDVKVKPSDWDVTHPGEAWKHYVSDGAALAALGAFIKKVGLPNPSAIVHSGGGFHIYWISDVALDPTAWRLYSEGLKQLLLAEGIKCDTGLTTDCARILRVPGTTNHKYSPARRVRVLHLGTDYKFETDLSFLKTVTPAATVAAQGPQNGTVKVADIDASFDGVQPLPAFAGLQGALQTGIEKPTTLLNPKPIFEQCGFLKEALITGGRDYSNPLWNLSVLCTVFMEDGNDYAHRISSGHATYTATDTQTLFDRKMVDRADRGIGYPSCASIQGSGCKACATCPLFAKGKSPLNIRPANNSPPPGGGGVTATVIPQSADAVSLQLPDGYDVDGAGIICKVVFNPKDPENPAWVQLFYNRIADARVEKDPDILIMRVSHDKGNWHYASLKMEDLRGQGAEKLWAKQRIRSRGDAKVVGDFMVAWMSQMLDAAVAQTAQSFGWYRDDTATIRGFAYGGHITFTDGTMRTAGMSDPEVQKRFKPKGQLTPWYDAMKFVTMQHRPELELVVAVAFAAPLMEFTGVTGGMLATYGESGVGKTYALEIGAAVWGHPRKTKETSYSTPKSVLSRLGHTTGMPCYWDEVTDEETQTKVLSALMQTTAGVEGSRLYSDVTSRDRGTWSTIIAINANISFKEYIGRKQNTHSAGLNRVLEYKVEHPARPVGVVQTSVSDAALGKLQHNYGHIGTDYVKLLAANATQIEQSVQQTMSKLATAWNADREDRIWVGICAALIEGAKYGNDIAKLHGQAPIFNLVGLVQFVMDTFHANQTSRALESVRPTSKEFSEDYLSQYLKQRTNETLWVGAMATGPGRVSGSIGWYRINANAPSNHGINVVFSKGDNKLRISKSDFRAWCKRTEISAQEVLDSLKKNFGLTEERRVLAAGTIWKTGQEHCIVIDVTGHPGLEEALSTEAALNSDLGTSTGITPNGETK